MRLFDRIVTLNAPPADEALPNAHALGEGIRGAPLRYVLDDTVAVIATETAFGHCESVLDCMDLLRIPAPKMWMEWCDASRRRAMVDLGLYRPAGPAPARPGRAGLLIQTDETGRRGRIDVAWSGEEGGVELSPLEIMFDLDDAEYANGMIDLGDGAEALMDVQVRKVAPLARLFQHVRFQFRPQWRAHYSAMAASDDYRYRAAVRAIKDVAGDLPVLLAFCLILTAKGAVELAPISLDRLNVSRRRSGKPELLDHMEVIACLDDVPGVRVCDVSARARAAARLHFVRGHLVRRGPQVFWRRPHVRGNVDVGAVRSRTVSVRARNRLPA